MQSILRFLAIYILGFFLLTISACGQQEGAGSATAGERVAPAGEVITDFPESAIVTAPRNGYQIIHFRGAQKSCRYYHVESGRAVPGTYSLCRDFDSNGRAVVRDLVTYRNGLIDDQGELMLPPDYDHLVEKCGLYFGDKDEHDQRDDGELLDPDGRVVFAGITGVSLCLNPTVNQSQPVYYVQRGALTNLLVGGELLFPWKYEVISPTVDCPDAYFVVGKGGKFGVVTAAGKEIEPLIHDSFRVHTSAHKVVLGQGESAREVYYVRC